MIRSMNSILLILVFLYDNMIDVGLEFMYALNGFRSILDGAIASLANPIHHVLDLPGHPWLESFRGLVKSAGFDDAEQVSASVPIVAGIPIGLRRQVDPDKGMRSRRESIQTEEQKGTSSPSPNNRSAFGTVVPRAMLVFLVLDILSLVLVRQSFLNPCTSKLFIAQWIIGGVLLGFPATWLVDSVRQEYSFRSAFVTELMFLAISFLWLCFGGARIFNAVSACVDTIAPLWWLSYVSSVLSLSLAGTVIFCMIVTTVLSLIYGSTTK